jgi:hypothetical protein
VRGVGGGVGLVPAVLAVAMAVDHGVAGAHLAVGLGLTACLAGIVRAQGLTAAGLGLARSGWPAGLRWGAVAAAAVAAAYALGLWHVAASLGGGAANATVAGAVGADEAGTRVLYLQHPAMVWLPLVTFWQVTADLPLSTGVPDGHGHQYHVEFVDGWAKVLQPPGWSTDKAERLRGIIAAEG